jgi:Uma2 family endonuclease
MVSVQTIHHGVFTFEDLDALPDDDGMRYELFDGMLLVTPAPAPLHQQAVLETAVLLRAACPADTRVFVAPVDFRPTSRRSLQPDVMVVGREDVGPAVIERAPLLVVEVLSPSTRSKDWMLKTQLYAEAGVPSYWLVDPDEPSVTVLELSGDRYVEKAVVRGNEEYDAAAPFGVRVVPADLIR